MQVLSLVVTFHLLLLVWCLPVLWLIETGKHLPARQGLSYIIAEQVAGLGSVMGCMEFLG